MQRTALTAGRGLGFLLPSSPLPPPLLHSLIGGAAVDLTTVNANINKGVT
jgi:hypothetical protein